MPRIGRKPVGGTIYHVMNRGNMRRTIFHKPRDYDAFVGLLAEIRKKVPIRVLGLCLMPNHWHLVLWPKEDGELSNFMLRLTTAHVRRHHKHYESFGGHLYQGRYKSFPVQDDGHLVSVLCYVESNPLRRKTPTDPVRWKWGSFALRGSPLGKQILCEWPIERPRNWATMLQGYLSDEQIESIQRSLRRGTPYGDNEWRKAVAKKLGLEFTLNPVGRPRDAAK